ncbi:MAG: MFS transporter [Aeriscardovia sp.]|nr:MFS transporter [Aeriscardovia sp.]
MANDETDATSIFGIHDASEDQTSTGHTSTQRDIGPTGSVPNPRATKMALLMLLVVYILGTLCLQAFDMVFAQVGAAVGNPDQASLISAVPGVVLGIACFVYGALGDFVSLRVMTAIGVAALLSGSVLGFFAHSTLLLVVLARSIQTLGYQAAGSAYVVIASKYLTGRDKVLYFGFFTAGFQLSSLIGVLCAGFLTSVGWQWLFLIPALAAVMIVPLKRTVPRGAAPGGSIDVLGFTLFGAGILFLTLFFSQLLWWEIALSAILFLVFAVHISRARHPFITPSFFRNNRWLSAIMLIAVLYFTQFCCTPLFDQIGQKVYGITTERVSLLLAPSFVAATIVACSSGAIVEKLGRRTAILCAAGLETLGYAFLAFLAPAGPAMLLLGSCLLYSGMGMLYSPVYDTVLATLPMDQSGRGVGMNDLSMEAFASIGVALFGPAITGSAFSRHSLMLAPGLSGERLTAATNVSALLWIFAAIQMAGIIWLLVFSRRIYQDDVR